MSEPYTPPVFSPSPKYYTLFTPGQKVYPVSPILPDAQIVPSIYFLPPPISDFTLYLNEEKAAKRKIPRLKKEIENLKDMVESLQKAVVQLCDKVDMVGGVDYWKVADKSLFTDSDSD